MSTAWQKRFGYMPAVLMAAGIAIVSLWENPQAPLIEEIGDKTIHAVIYAVFALTLMFGAMYNRHTGGCSYLIIGFIAASYGALMEFLQAFCTLTRSGDWRDEIFNIIGVIIGLAAAYACRKIIL